MRQKIGSTTRGRTPRTSSVNSGGTLPLLKFSSLVTFLSFTFFSCTPYYSFHPLPVPDPKSMTHRVTLSGTKITVGVKTYHTAGAVHRIFGRNGLWREHVVPIHFALVNEGTTPVQIRRDTLFLQVLNNRYSTLSPAEAFDIAYRAKVPYQTVKKTLYYTGLILFTIVTLGLGSMIWVLPSPFAQPLPSQVPFGRDLGYKALADKVTILPRGRISGLLYFNTPYEDQVVAKGSIEFQVLEKNHSKNPEGLSVKGRIPLNSSGKTDLNPVIEILHGFF